MLKRGFNWLKMHRLAAALFVIGIISIVYQSGMLPPGLNQDEASIGYDAFSILHYGVDRNGMFMPVHLIAWGSGQNALYAYLSMPFIYVFGLTVWSVRAASMLLGLLSLVLLYAIGKRLFEGERGALIALFLGVVSPWHLMMSRWALESNLFPALALLAFYFLLKGLEKNSWRWFAAFAAVMALCLYSYGTAYLFVPVFCGLAAVLLLYYKMIKPVSLLLYGGILTVLALPIAAFVWINRFDGASIVTPLFSIPKLTVPRVEEISSVFSGQGLTPLWNHAKSFLKLFLTGDDGLLWNAVPPYGYLYPIAVPFILFGIAYSFQLVWRSKSIGHALLLSWLAAAIMVALVTEININRINIIFYPLLLFASGGIVPLWQRWRLAAMTAIISFGLFFAAFAAYYFTTYSEKLSMVFFESFGDAVSYASDQTDGTVYVTPSVNMPYIYVLFYERIDPRDFADSVVYGNPGGAFQQVSSFGRYRFQHGEPQLGETAAYIYASGEVNAEQMEQNGYQVKRFKHYTVVVGGTRIGQP
ncbi:hypothetical protein A7K91_08580 [Paenibacillus oryzae]|uniref:Glycosyltransferase RgtA/B/C/D-like domain-containing protein n=1 Tax=Paenibacillus oryzae TaxID=1844972 RepID=A0A1A5YQE3_9BACL|nr:glycosyltransferase family 39 protein [Paenibacillus oryzae]OBR67779.1 hypothetical protein A7K91_08580 [Paenibacillus oryzae]